MRILWLTVDRSQRVAKLFDPLQREADQIADVTFVRESVWTLNDVMKGRTEATELDPTWVNEFDVLFTDAIFAFQNQPWDRITIPKAVLIEDQHGPAVASYTNLALNVFGFGYFFVRYYGPAMDNLPYLQRADVRWLPHSIDPGVFCERDLDRSGAVLTGSLGDRIYPMRNDILRHLEKEAWFSIVRRPAEHNPEDRYPVGEDYARILGSAHVSFATSSVYKYLVAKYFEIPACGTMLMAEWVDEMRTLGFEPWKNFGVLDPVAPMKQQVERWLDDVDGMRAIAQAGHDLVHERHTAAVRARELTNHLENILGDDSSTRTYRQRQTAQL